MSVSVLWLPLVALLGLIIWQQSVIKRLRRRPSVILSTSPGRELAEEYAHFIKGYAAALSEHGIVIPGLNAIYESDEKKMANIQNIDSGVSTGHYL